MDVDPVVVEDGHADGTTWLCWTEKDTIHDSRMVQGFIMLQWYTIYIYELFIWEIFHLTENTGSEATDKEIDYIFDRILANKGWNWFLPSRLIALYYLPLRYD